MTVHELGVEDRASFHAEARYQRVCAVCGKPNSYHAHHVVYEQRLKKDYGLVGKQLYNTANALRLCTSCHERHHKAIRKVRVKELKSQNLTYAFAIMGDYAMDWLRRYYDDTTDPDQRVETYLQTGVQA